ncbi:hypothetical protein scyTo_0013091 [Scyliorhinus torazame]|uniref:NAD(P)-binding domain-containing protein n=1 Tax=Scyliorhinus torazame TaxID=75743 RepID=A0A401NP75_SCYTO|nr:hypothetical protein [Scyliorhinus torazame]
MSAADRTVLVLGGAGTVGSGIVKVLLEKGFRVAAISRDAARLEKLKNFVPAATRSRLFTLVGDVGTEDGAEAAKNALLQAVGKVTDIVSSLGFSWWQGGPPHTQTLEELNKVLNTLVFSTFTSWKAFFPLVKDDCNRSYTFITGGAGERLLMPGTGFLTLGAAGALAFCQVVREEYPDVPCKLNERGDTLEEEEMEDSCNCSDDEFDEEVREDNNGEMQGPAQEGMDDHDRREALIK